MDLYIRDLSANVVLLAALTAWFIAQLLKVFFVLIKEGYFDLERMVGSGGMPSSHSALVVALCCSIGIYHGISSHLFALSFFFACIVMYDAAGVRRAAGKQARFLNELIEEILTGHKFNDTKFKELLGHTPLEVLAGALLGAGVAYGYYLWY
ncbi:MAG: divergent PAP2 family protein [Veillonellaceae bacterium]|nr:divergent PAP2 family protein [Veillonellaceae bacterium]